MVDEDAKLATSKAAFDKTNFENMSEDHHKDRKIFSKIQLITGIVDFVALILL